MILESYAGNPVQLHFKVERTLSTKGSREASTVQEYALQLRSLLFTYPQGLRRDYAADLRSPIIGLGHEYELVVAMSNPPKIP